MKKLLYLFTLLFVFVLYSSITIAQPITVDVSLAADTFLIKGLLDNSNTDVYNIQFTGDPVSYGIFSQGNSNFSLPLGIILTNGKATNATGPNNSGSISYNNSGLGNSLLDELIPQTTYDASILEYDFVSCDSMYRLSVVFGSDEYLEWVNSPFNDVFAIFISGPNPNSGYPDYDNVNIALIPGSPTPISINNVNNTTNSTYFVNNGTGATPSDEALQYDGYTTPITCQKRIVPGETYHIVVAIADGGDSAFDSGVLFCRSLNSIPDKAFSVSLHSAYGFGNQIIEGYQANLHFEKADSTLLFNSTIIYLDFGINPANAIPGVDYVALPDSVIIPAGDMSIDVPLDFVNDGINETNEWFYINCSDTCPYGGIKIYAQVLDEYIFDAGIVQNNISICDGSSIFLTAFANATDSMVSYSWSNGSSNDSVFIPGGVAFSSMYYLTVTHSDGFVVEDSVSVNISPSMNSMVVQLADYCNFDTLDLQVSGGATPYSYIWSNGATIEDIIDAVSGTYAVTVTGALGCSQSHSFSIVTHGPIQTNILSLASCGQTQGFLAIETSNGTPPYSYTWSNGTAMEVVVPAIAGNYFVTVSDALGCLVTDSIIGFDPQPMSIDLNYSTAGCLPSLATADVSGGNPPFELSWSNLTVGSQTSIQQAGNYSLTVQDTAGCTLVDSFTIASDSTNFMEITDIISIDPCSNMPGSIDIAIISGAAPVAFFWSNGETSEDIDSLVSGTYWLTISDNNYCHSVFEYTIPAFQNPTVSYSLDLTPVSDCIALDNGSAVVIANSDASSISYLWSTGSTDSLIHNLGPGIYYLTLSDLCHTFVDTVTIEYQSPISHNLTTSPSHCHDSIGTVAINLNFPELVDSMFLQDNFSGNLYFPDSSGIFQSLASTVYDFTLVDTFGCTISDSVFVDIEFSTPYYLYPNDAYCNDSTGEVHVSIIYSGILDSMFLQSNTNGNYFFPVPTDRFDSLPGDNYLLTLVDTFGCTSTDTVQIEYVPGFLNAGISTAYCQGFPVLATANIQAPGSANPEPTYLIEYPTFNHEPLSGGVPITSYYIDDTYHGPFPIGFDFDFFGNSVSDIYVGSNGWVSFSPLSSNTYDPWLTQSIPNTDPSRPRNAIFALYRDWHPGLASLITYNVTGAAPNRKLVINFIDVPLFSCNSFFGTFQVVLFEGSDIIDINIINGPTCPTWNNGNGVVGIQNATGSSAYPVPGCNNTNFEFFDFSVRFNPQNAKWYNPAGILIGEGNTITFNADTTGTYTCEAYTYCGLETVEVEVEYLYNFNLDLGGDQVLCPNETIILQLPPNISGTWSTGVQDTALFVNQAGAYSVNVALGNGYCQWSDGINISAESINFILVLDTAICMGDTILIEFDTSYFYQWSNGSSENWLSLYDSSIYYVTVATQNCTLEDTLDVSIAVLPLPISIIPYDTTKCPNQSLFLDGGNEPLYTYQWSTGSNSDYTFIDSAGLYTLTLTDTSGCIKVDSVWVSEQADVSSGFIFFESFNHVQFINQSENAYWYTWDFGDGSPLSNELNPEHDYPVQNQNVWYTATLISSNQCGEDTAQMQILTFYIDELDDNSGLQIFPNPNRGNFFLSGNLQSKDDLSIQVFTTTGKKIYQKEIPATIGKFSEEINLGQAAPGIYYLKAQQKEKSWVWKVVVE